ncbi:gamma-interferon-responsive lysosomal thiol protein-like isoform X2 [Abrus precatorius]|uniref:Gamma-interferon-responsive lysosomal thiol protein-like isoform X2 n=1 Tax=Abrus precatorius TaxID=3816 RepID=A0A8B8K074_ABRPR|nr:gamma-interferon-responsive lysosomal thiol protein-like isoform X2 [Abrus precatorius]
MVFPKQVNTILLILFLFFFIYESKGASYSSGSHTVFIIKDLENIFYNGLISIVNLQLVPWANAYVNNTNNSISCQNGPEECKLNSLESCVLNLYPNVDTQYAVIVCLEFMAIDGRFNRWNDCLNQLDLPKQPILNCLKRGNGIELGKKYINETAQLYPPPSLLPWVVVNNEPIGNDYANVTYYVCKAYRGVAVPEACNLHLK